MLSNPNSASISSRIWDNAPAALWNDSFVIGNGRIGAVIGGVVASDAIHVNEDSLWSGGPLYRVNPDAKSQMPFIQQDIRNGHIPNAATLASYAYAGTPVSTQHYDPLGDLTLTMTDTDDDTTYYERWLDVADGTSGVFYTLKGVDYERELIASEPAGIIAMRLTASRPGALSFHLHLDRGDPSLNRWEDLTKKVGSDTIIMAGASGGYHPVSFATGAKIVSPDGEVSTLGDYVFCKKATEALIYFQAWTSFRKEDPYYSVLADLDSVQSQSYDGIRATHVSDYQSYFNRTALSLGTSTEAQKSQTTRARVKALAKGAFDPEVASLYFDFGRYLLIATSRAGTLPPNLQGIWNSDLDPEWGSKYTININLQMNYWPSLVTNLADLTSPLYDLIDRMREKGSGVAQAMYNSSGAMSHHNTDAWADCAPQVDNPDSVVTSNRS
jgi:alpha-L-fucosidase 2